MFYCNSLESKFVWRDFNLIFYILILIVGFSGFLFYIIFFLSFSNLELWCIILDEDTDDWGVLALLLSFKKKIFSLLRPFLVLFN